MAPHPKSGTGGRGFVPELGLGVHVDRSDLTSMQPLVAEVEDILELGSECQPEKTETGELRARGFVTVLPAPQHVLGAARQPEHVEVTEVPPGEPRVDRNRELKGGMIGRHQEVPAR